MKIRYYLFLTLTFFSFFCFGQSKGNGANYTFNTKCIGTELDGSITLEVWGKGRHYFDALEQAKKNAVRDIIFRGIQDGNCQISAIVLLPKVKSTHEEYFAEFFSDDGPYLEFVSLKDERILNKMRRNKKKTREMQQRKVVVRVNRLGLKKKLKSDNIN